MAITKFLSDISIDGDLSSIGTVKTLTNGDGLVFSSPTTVKFKLGVYGANDLLFKDPSNNVLMSLTSAGNLGIGTTTPQRVLDVNVGGNSGVGASFAGTISAGEYQGIHFGYSEAGNGNYRHSAIVFERDDATHGDARGKIHILNSASGVASANLGDSRLTVLPSGNVGIGTTSPSSNLHVHGAGGSGVATQIKVTQADDGAGHPGASAILQSSGWGEAFLKLSGHQISAAGGDFNVTSSTNLALQTNGTNTRMFIKSDGNIGIGTTSPSYGLDVNHNAARIGSSSQTTTSLYLTATNTAGAPAIATQIIMQGYEGRAKGTFYTDSGVDGEWFDGIPYNGGHNYWQVGFDETGGQAEYLANAKLTVRDNGNVGIGTTSPGAKLDINGIPWVNPADGVHSGWNFRQGGVFKGWVGYVDSNDVVNLSMDGSIANGINVNASHNVGIGTASPEAKLHIIGGHLLLNNALELRSKDTSGNIKTITRVNSSNELEYGWSGAGAVKFMGGGSYTERMRIHTNGNVGIGTTSPNEKLTVAGNIHAYAPSGINAGLFASTAAGATSIAIRSSGVTFFNAGNVGIGTTSPNAKLEVTGNIEDNWAGRFENTNTGGYGILAKIAGTSADERIFEARVGTSTKMLISGDGNATFAADVTVGGNLIVNGTTTTLNTTTVEVEDNILQLNTTQGTPDTATAATSGISVYRGDGVTQASLIFDDGDDTWDLTNNLKVAGLTTIGTGTTGSPYDATTFLHVKGTTRSIVQQSSTADAYYMFGDAAANNVAWLGYNHSTGGLDLHAETAITLDKNTTVVGSLNAIGAIEVKDSDGSTTLSHVRAMSNTTEGWLSLSNGSNWGLIARGVANEPRLGAYHGGVLKIEGFHSSDGATGSNAIDFAQFQFGNNHFQMNAATSTFAGNVTIDNGTSSTLIIEKNATGGGKIQFNDAGSQEAYVSLDAAEDMTFYAAANNNQIFYSGGVLNETKTGANSTFAGTIDSGAITSTGVIKSNRAEAQFELVSTHGRTSYINQGGGNLHIKAAHASGVGINYGDTTNPGLLKLYNNTTAKITLDATAGNATFAGRVTHNGIELTSGFAVDQIKEFPMTFQLAANTWTDTGIDGADLSTGTYAMQVYVSDFGVGGQHYYEYYSATISWYGGATNSTTVDEIPVHRAGHAPNTGDIQFRTQRASGSDSHDLMLQVKTNLEYTEALDNDDGGKIMRFKFRRLM